MSKIAYIYSLRQKMYEKWETLGKVRNFNKNLWLVDETKWSKAPFPTTEKYTENTFKQHSSQMDPVYVTWGMQRLKYYLKQACCSFWYTAITG